MKGSEHNDEFFREKKSRTIHTRTNFAGGILGGISNGEDIVLRVAVKPPSSIPKSQKTVDTRGRKRTVTVEGRHDPCLCPRIVPVVESMIALVIADHLMRQTMLARITSIRRIRDHIDLTDEMILLLLNYRQDLVREVGRWKRIRLKPVSDPRRERQILSTILRLSKGSDLEPRFLKRIYAAIFDYSRTVQQEV